LRLRRPLRLGLTASFALATTALPYVRQVNNHILLLGVAAALFLHVAWFAEEMKTGSSTRFRLLVLGLLAGLGYTMDLGAGPVLFLGTLGIVVWHRPRLRHLLAFASAALPWVLLHHVLNYAVGGTLKPANAVSDYFAWPGCTFNVQNMTG